MTVIDVPAGQRRELASPPQRVLVLAQLPPPVHGVTATTRRVVDVISGEPRLVAEQLWSGSASSLADVDARSLNKLGQLAGLNVRLLWRTIRGPRYAIAYTTLAPWSHAALRDGLMAWWGCRVARRSLVHLHGEGLAAAITGSGLKARAMRFLLRGSELIAITGGAAATAEASGLFSRVHRLANAAPDPGKRLRAGPTGEPLRVGFLGNLDPRKGVLTFLDVVAQAAAAGAPLAGGIAGGATRHLSPESLARMLADRGLAPRFTAPGAVYGEAKQRFLAGLDVFLYPSEHDHAPLVIIEAMAHGAVPVVLDTGGIAELLGTGLAHNVVPAALPAGERQRRLAAALARYASDPEALAADAMQARARYEAAFTEAAFAARLREIVAMPRVRAPTVEADLAPPRVRLPLPAAIKRASSGVSRALHRHLALRPLPQRVAIYFHALEAPERAALAECVAALRGEGYRTVGLDEYVAASGSERLATFSCDDNYVSWHTALPDLERLRLAMTFYVNTLPLRDVCPPAEVAAYFDRIGYRGSRQSLSRAELVEMARAGHTIASHGHAHHLVADLPPASWSEELRRPKDVLEDLIGREVAHYSWAYGMPRHITPAQKDFCAAIGYRTIAAATPAMLHAAPLDLRALPRSEWRSGRSRADNLIDLRIDGRLFTRLTGRSAIG